MIDIAVNLADKAFRSDWQQVVRRALDAGVSHQILTGTDLGRSRDSLALVDHFPEVLRATAGVHPHHAAQATDADFAAFEALWARPEVVAVGECGLDYFRDLSPRPRQREVFERHFAAAARSGKPLFMHERDAGPDMIAILRANRQSFDRGVIHCFTASPEVLRQYLDLDLHIGITGWICHETRGLELRETVRLIPDDRLMIETDAPYLYPMSLRPLPPSRRNEPAFLGAVRDRVAACRGQTAAEVDERTSRNAREFFGLD